MRDQRPIGCFDSGIGGLTVLREAITLLPNEHYIYLGDTKHVPYGQRSSDEIRTFASEAIQTLIDRDIKALVLACNTVSAVALEQIKHLAGTIPVIDVIHPTVQSLPEKTGTIVVLATQATVNSHIYKQKIQALTNRPVIEFAPSLFVPLIEHHLDDEERIHRTIEQSLAEIKKDTTVDTVILGCTHYPIIKTQLAEFFGPSVTIVDSSLPTAKALKTTLIKENLHNHRTQSVEIHFTGPNASRSLEIARLLLPNVQELQ